MNLIAGKRQSLGCFCFTLAVVWSYLPEDYLRHFYVLHCAISILCNVADCKYNNEYAKKLLVHFVQAFKTLYGEEYVIYNVHNLIHLPEEVKIHGCLDMFSAFPFENFLQPETNAQKKRSTLRTTAKTFNRKIIKHDKY